MAKEFIPGLMGEFMTESGERMLCTEWEDTHGKMAESTSDAMLMIRNMVKGLIYGLMGRNTAEDGRKGSSMGRVLLLYLMELLGKESGKKAKE